MLNTVSVGYILVTCCSGTQYDALLITARNVKLACLGSILHVCCEQDIACISTAQEEDVCRSLIGNSPA